MKVHKTAFKYFGESPKRTLRAYVDRLRTAVRNHFSLKCLNDKKKIKCVKSFEVKKIYPLFAFSLLTFLKILKLTIWIFYDISLFSQIF